MWKLGEQSKKNMQGVDNRLVEICGLALSLSPIDFGIPQYGGMRTVADQHLLFGTGKSKCDGVKNKSYHQSGKALDFYAYVDGKASWDHLHLTTVAAAFLQAAIELEYDISWGGLWKNFRDMPHVQIED